MEKKKGFRAWSWKRTLLLLLLLILAAVAAAILTAWLYMDHLLDQVNYVTQQETVSPEEAASIAQEDWETIPPEDTTPVAEPIVPTVPDVPEEQGSHIVNILLIGQDRQPGQGRQRSDSMILVTFDKSAKQIALTSIMRDQLVTIPGYGSDKLCHAYQYGGMDLLDRTLYDHFGVQIHGNVEVDLSGFEAVIDILGGVDIQLTKAEAGYINAGHSGDLTEGLNHLNGEQALAYARIRELDNDYKRAQRQRTVLLSLMEKYRDQDISTMLELLEEILPYLTTDIPKKQIISYAVELFPMLSGAQIQTLRIPADGTFRSGYVRVSSYHRMWCQYDIDFQANRDLLQQLFSE